MLRDIFRHETDDAGRKETGRIEALSDGIFAIAMTLLVLDIRVPDVESGGSLTRALRGEWPAFVAFAIGFFTLLICWINHHYMYEAIQKADGFLMLFNGLKLLVVSFTPFATAVLSRYINTDFEQTAVNIYALNFFVMGMSMTAVWCYACWRGYAQCRSPQVQELSTRLYVFATVIPGLILALSFISVWASLALFVFMFGVYIYPQASVRMLARYVGAPSAAAVARS